MTTPRTRGTLWTLAGLVTLLMVLPLASAGAAPAFQAPNPNAPAPSWAYGGGLGATASTTGTATSGVTSYAYQINSHVYLDWNILFTQTNTSTTTFTINATRTVTAVLFAQGCSPSCSSPVAQINITATGWEDDYAWANFTTAGTVLLNGTTSVPAVALQNEHVYVAGNLTAQSTWSARVSSGNAYISSQVEAQASAVFSPALGLFPMTLGVGQTWSSSSAYTATGSFAKACHGYASNVGSSSCTSSGSLSGSGNVTLMGADTGWGVTVHGRSYGLQVVTLGVTTRVGSTYTFDMADGIFLLPHATNQFAPSPSVGTTTGSTAASGIATDALDVNAQGGHFGLSAAKGELDSSVSTGDIANIDPAGSADFAVGAPQDASVQPLVVQAAPESVSCASTGNCPSLSAGVPPTHYGGLILVGALVAVGAVVVVLVIRRRGPQGPSRTAGTTLPPRTMTSPGSSPNLPSSGTSPEPAQDPLSNLW